MGGYTAATFRSVFVVAVLLLIAHIYKRLEFVDWKHNWPYLAGMFFASLFVWGPLYYAILHAGLGISFAINYASIVIGMFFFGWWLASERITKDKWASALLGIVGLGLVFSPSVSNLGWLALGGSLISGLAVAAISVLAKKIPYNATQSTIAVWGTGLIASAIMALIIKESFPQVGWHVEWFYLLIFSLASVIASWAFVGGVKLIEAGAAGILGLLEIVFGVLFGVLFFSERPGAVVLLGILIIITAAAIPYIKEFNLKRGTL